MSGTGDRLRRWATEEKEKLSGIKGAEKKASYVWEYYKIWIIAIIFVLWFIPFAVHQYTTQINEYRCFMMFCNTFADIGDDSDLWDDYISYTGFDTEERKVHFNASSYFDYLKGVTGNSYFEAFVAYADSGTLDGITMGTESLRALGKSGRLLDLDSDSCRSIRAKYGDRFIYSVPYDEEYSTEEVPVGIDISDSRLVTEYGAYSEPCALGIGALSGNVDAIELFLDFIFEEQEN